MEICMHDRCVHMQLMNSRGDFDGFFPARMGSSNW